MSRWRPYHGICRLAWVILSLVLLLGGLSAQAAELLVSSLATDQVLRYDGTTGAFAGVFVAAGSGGLDRPAVHHGSRDRGGGVPQRPRPDGVRPDLGLEGGPGVDGGILTIHRREHPLLSPTRRRQFHALVHRVYTGPGRGLAQILACTTSLGSPQTAQAWLTRHGMTAAGLPKDMPVEAWVDLFKTTGSSPPAHRAQTQQVKSRRRRR